MSADIVARARAFQRTMLQIRKGAGGKFPPHMEVEAAPLGGVTFALRVLDEPDPDNEYFVRESAEREHNARQSMARELLQAMLPQEARDERG